ncbi:MAG: ATP-binding protein [Leptospiraceae bacterium]|jgi:predicted AAA+ superfamily ATPase|nr:ATP-binding protein [Leptospiraceae bacterium]MBK9498391.1 ATP-binding protein [Leptospiraceae bacterium]
MDRLIFQPILEDLKSKMVFIGGPRQCGKTFLAKEVLKAFHSEKNYFNWDSPDDRKIILAQKWGKERLIALDEIHKYPKWKNFVKGIYDTQRENHNFLITGSARLDLYKRGGDSMFGRYHYWRLHPFTLSELPQKISVEEAFKRLMKVGGFPEPFLDASEQTARRWRKERFDLILREDIRDLERVNEIQNISLLVDLLKTRVGSLIVVSNLANDLQVASNTVKRWIEILERMYLIFVVRPYTDKLSRAISKPFKIYFYDNADVEGDEGAIFENLVATHLLKKIQFTEDSEGYRQQLYFIRDKEGREVDFAITKDKKLEFLIEAKWSEEEVSKNLTYYSEKLNPMRSLQLVANLKREYKKNKTEVLSAKDFLANLS